MQGTFNAIDKSFQQREDLKSELKKTLDTQLQNFDFGINLIQEISN